MPPRRTALPSPAEATEAFSGPIRVASKIIDYLSSGLYDSPAACLKELVNNSYDADAATVHLHVQPDADQIVIQDDGQGMTKEEFIENFSWISETHKRDTSEFTTRFRRPKIGKIGIGFIAANEICEEMRVVSSKEGDPHAIDVRIDFSKLRLPASERRVGELTTGQSRESASKGPVAYEGGDFEGKVLPEEREAHYTIVFLNRVKGPAREILAGAAGGPSSDGKSLYGWAPDRIANLLSSELSTWGDLDDYGKSMLELALYVPVPYQKDWVDRRLSRSLAEVEDRVRKLRFRVLYDGTELFKPIMFSGEPGSALVAPFELNGKEVSASGYFYAQHGKLTPIEQNGLLVRVRNVAIGRYDSGFWGFRPSIGPMFQTWVSAEVYADDRLEAAMNIDRKSFQRSHPAYRELQQAIHNFLQFDLFRTVRAELYASGRERRDTEKIKDAWAELQQELERARSLGPRHWRGIEAAWRELRADPERRRALLRRYTPADIYRFLADCLEESPDADVPSLIRCLTRRLVE